VDEERDVRVGDNVGRLARGGVRRHDNDGAGRVGRRGEVGVVHEGNVGDVVGSGREVKLQTRRQSVSQHGDSFTYKMPRLTPRDGCGNGSGRGVWTTHESGILEALDHVHGQLARQLLVGVALGRLVVERYLVHGGWPAGWLAGSGREAQVVTWSSGRRCAAGSAGRFDAELKQRRSGRCSGGRMRQRASNPIDREQ